MLSDTIVQEFYYLGVMKTQKTASKDKAPDDAATIKKYREWLANDLKRIASLATMLQDPIVLDTLANHVHGLAINAENKKQLEDAQAHAFAGSHNNT